MMSNIYTTKLGEGGNGGGVEKKAGEREAD